MKRAHSILTLTIVFTGCLAMSALMIWRGVSHYKHSVDEQATYFALHTFANESSVVWSSVPSTCALNESDASAYPKALVDDFLLVNGPWSRPTTLSVLEGRAALIEWGSAHFTDERGIEHNLLETGRPVWSVSRTAFNANKTRALVCVEREDPLSNATTSTLYALRRSDDVTNSGEWHVVDERSFK